MAGDTRTLKLAILADTANLVKGLKQSETEVQGFGDKLTKFGKMAGAAFAAAGAAAAAYAGKLLVDGVKAAIEDAAAQERLAQTLTNVTGATNLQIAAVEDYITQTALATGVTDDELRPSLERLARATGDVAEAQKLQSLALDIAAGSGQSLEAVSNALGKAYEGNTTALGKLGVGLSKAELASMSMEEITAKLADTFGGQAARQADTFQGKMGRLKVAFDEAKETVGSYLLNAITPLVDGLVKNVIPALSKTAEGLGKELAPAFDSVAKFVRDILLPALQTWWKFLSQEVWPAIVGTLSPILIGLGEAFGFIAKAVKDNEDKLKPLYELFRTIWAFVKDYLAPVIGKTLGEAVSFLGKALGVVIDIAASVASTIAKAMNAALSGIESFINGVINAWNRLPDWLRPGGKVGNIDITPAAIPTVKPSSVPTMPTYAPGGTGTGIGTGTGAGTGGGTGGGTGTAAAAAAKAAAAAEKAAIQKQIDKLSETEKMLQLAQQMNKAYEAQQAGQTIINVTGTMLDPEGVAREVARVMEASAGRTGSYPTLGLNPIGLTPVVL